MSRVWIGERDRTPFGPKFLASGGEVGDGEDGIFPRVEEDWLDWAAFHLLRLRHGGAGLGLSLTDVEEMQYARILWWIDHLLEALEKEAKSLKGGG